MQRFGRSLPNAAKTRVQIPYRPATADKSLVFSSLESGICGGPQPAVLAAVEWRCMTPGGGPLDFEARQRNTAVHRSIRFRFRPG